MDSDDSAEVEGAKAASVNCDEGVVGRIVLCGVFGQGVRRKRMSEGSRRSGPRHTWEFGIHPALKYRSSKLERMLEERGVHTADGQEGGVFLGIRLFRSFAFLESRQTEWHSKECMAMYSALAANCSDPTLPGAILMPVVAAAELSHPMPYRSGEERAWWCLADWRETLMADGATTVLWWWARPHSVREVICGRRPGQ